MCILNKTKCLICGSTQELLHRFPKADIKRKMWYAAIRREDLNNLDATYVINNGRLCAIHFEDWCYCSTKRGRLIACAMPSTETPAPNIVEPTFSPKDLSSVPERENRTKLCSKLFPESFKTEQLGGPCCTETEVPTISDFPAHLCKVCEPRSISSQDFKNIPARPSESSAIIPSCTFESLKESPTHKKTYVGDIQSEISFSPSEKKKSDITQKQLRKQKKIIQNLAHKNSFLKRKATTLETMLDQLKKKSPINDSEEETLQLSLPGTTKELRCFALTLQFYSSEAYDYVHKTFNTSLPDSSALNK